MIVTNEEIIQMYEKKAANISATCTALGIKCRNTFYSRRKASKKLDEALTDIEESLIDFAESKLLEQMQNGNLTALLFYLKTKGKKRGYVEGQEINANLNGFQMLMQKLDEQEAENE